MSDQRISIYISHASEDQQASNRLHESLLRAGFQPWLCEIDVLPGSDPRAEMDRVLNLADVFLYIVSRHSTSRQGSFQGELERALARHKTSDVALPAIIPIRLDDSHPPPELLSFRAVDYGDEEGPARLLAALRNLVFKTSRVVFSLHGIKSRGKWQKDLVPLLSSAGFKPVLLDYGNFLALQLLFGPSRRKKVDWLLKEYIRECARNQATRPSIVAHSLGSYLVAEVIRKYRGIDFDRIVLCGSIVPRSYPWQDIFNSNQAHAVLNQYGGQDVWARIVAWVVSDAGQSGLRGFDGTTERLLQQYNPEFGHSDYFNDLNYRDNWIPFLLGQAIDLGSNPAVTRRNWRFRITSIVTLLAVCSVLILIGMQIVRSHRSHPVQPATLFSSSRLQAPGRIPNWNPSPEDFSTGPMIIEQGKSTWWTGTLNGRVTTLQFQVELRDGQSNISWIAAPSKEEMITMHFPPTSLGANGVSYLKLSDRFRQTDSSRQGDNNLSFHGALDGERINAWLEILNDRSLGCQLSYTFQATAPLQPELPDDDARLAIVRALTPSADTLRSIPCQFNPPIEVRREFCSDPLNIGFDAREPNSGLKVIMVRLNEGTTGRDRTCRSRGKQ